MPNVFAELCAFSFRSKQMNSGPLPVPPSHSRFLSTHSTDSEGFQNNPFLCYSLNSKQHPNYFLKRVALNHKRYKSTKSCKEPSHWIISRTFLCFLQIPQKHHSFATAMNLRNHHFNRILRFPKKQKKCNKSGKKMKKGQFRQKEMQ